MQQDTNHDGLIESLRLIARRDRGIAVRIFVSIGATFLMIGVALIAAYVLAMFHQQYDARRGYYYMHVRDADLAMSFAGAAAVWGGLLWWIWRGQGRQNSLINPIVGTFVVAGAAFGIGVALDEFVRREEEYLIGATVLIAGAVISIIWMRYVTAFLRGNPVLGRDRQVNVICPECGYSLVGLNSLRCPECGETFTIDQLILAQGYGDDTAADDSERKTQTGTDVIRPPTKASHPVDSA